MAQNLKNHLRFFPPFHFFAVPLTLIGLGVSVYQAIRYPSAISWLIFLLFFLMFFAVLFGRLFSLKAQDRVIRTEENLRFFFLTGKPLPSQLQLAQIIALRFASDGEFVALTERVVKENLSSKEIKESIKNWRTDDYRI
ncbi:hypothetical protein ABIB40_000399 [Pedobacter sp. UYP30]|uniref:DUF6526 family protein n=1 Tax=Pedobacter sp. UYP30 TaxID=1756400 RepID=UPI003396783F